MPRWKLFAPKWQKVFSRLSNAEFHKIWQEKELEVFYGFLQEQAVGAHGFLITFPMDYNSLAWFFYPIESFEEIGGGLQIKLGAINAAIPEGAESRECPADWKGYPVWRVKEQDISS